MPQYRLMYFNIRARAETSRMIFAAAGVEYEDVRVAREQWPAEKASGKYPFGQVPCLEIDGKFMLAQSRSIGRYLANEFGLAGKDNLEKAKVDMVIDVCEDIQLGLSKFFLEKDETRKAEFKADLVVKADSLLAGLEKMLIKNNGGNGFFVGDSLTWADLEFMVRMEFAPLYDATLLDRYPKLKALVDRVSSVPNISAWLKKRPKTEF
ncbi:hematopoietic prostaglandin D synthase-like isoform X4 [Ptychodera flava]|uniref:hematopoietic prostaglandin D synthase-like isoform X4 n=1 Tax=Ptychodera flava TaxID=63121 RepID=UPI00396A5211